MDHPSQSVIVSTVDISNDDLCAGCSQMMYDFFRIMRAEHVMDAVLVDSAS